MYNINITGVGLPSNSQPNLVSADYSTGLIFNFVLLYDNAYVRKYVL